MEYKVFKVLTTNQLAKMFNTDIIRVYSAFTRHKDKFEEGKDYFLLSKSDIDEWSKTVNLPKLKHASILYLWTEQGAFKIGQTFKGTRAWQGYCNCICYYYEMQEYKKVLEELYEKMVSGVGK